MREKNRKFADLSLHSVLVVFFSTFCCHFSAICSVCSICSRLPYLLPAARKIPENNPLRIVLGIILGLKQFIYSFICNHCLFALQFLQRCAEQFVKNEEIPKETPSKTEHLISFWFRANIYLNLSHFFRTY